MIWGLPVFQVGLQVCGGFHSSFHSHGNLMKCCYFHLFYSWGSCLREVTLPKVPPLIRSWAVHHSNPGCSLEWLQSPHLLTPEPQSLGVLLEMQTLASQTPRLDGAELFRVCVYLYVCMFMCVQVDAQVCLLKYGGQKSTLGAVLQVPFTFLSPLRWGLSLAWDSLS